ncbi:acetylornithine/acetyl-lysine aminotransferase [Capsulimonas corticalis]|uniref:Acetylornithine/acetyl-lysine aminotransferase n=1 Tax=Capsulimonas corticalis TaxID=2219043 RepID=A0A402CQB0_9BACT|nr:aminotransferase class III-fold pyridoxal phosphate-dependent enzyme [Capsulimonas corticalis]BDI32722.1 acetylornithine/acetyl-lysine aminotransferase [Capsulimonas corticalis]
MTPSPRLLTPIPGPKSRDLAARLRQSESPNITYLADDFPVFWESASGCWVTDVDGNVFLDLTAAFGVAGVGHSHPDVVAAIQRQSTRLIHGMGDVHPSDVKVALCERIASRVPISEARVILGQNGADAVEAALKTAALATGRRGVLAFEGGYHGLSYGALDATFRDDFKAPFRAQLGAFTSHIPYGCALDDIARIVTTQEIGAVLVEPIQGRGGIIVPPSGWLAGLRDLCAAHNVLLIFDEIFTGWGRTGDWFACQYDDILPDILCIGKAMGGGMPISACVAGKDVMSAWPVSLGEALHTSTFLGNPLACAAALAATDVMSREDLPARAKESGAYFIHRLQDLQDRYPGHIHEVRGRGLMLGLKFSSRSFSLDLVTRALRAGLIILPAGDGSVIEFVPPLIITHEEIDCAIGILDALMRITA